MSRAGWANAAWWALCTPAYAAFRNALGNPADVQRRVLFHSVRANADTVYGRHHGFASIRTVREYQARVPLATYDDLEPLSARIAAGEPGLLTQEPVRMLEPTGGSSGPAKRIPYTGALQREINRAVGPWIFDLYLCDPLLAGGPAYWSITPAGTAAETNCGAVSEGFADDSEYLGGWAACLARAGLAVPSAVRHLVDVSTFRYVTMAYLVRCRHLRLISVWHPSFLALLFQNAAIHWDAWLRDVHDGQLRPPGGLPRSVEPELQRAFRPAPLRARELADSGPRNLVEIWPFLRLVSCWADGNAAAPARELENMLPGIRVQPKGLLATEGVITIPFAGAHVPALRSHFFEFLTADGTPRLIHELDRGEDYEVVITTGGGLYRYRMEDRVRVTGHHRRTPVLRFLGKSGHISDRFGEKLSEAFVTAAVERATAGLPVRFALLAPEIFGERTGYVLFLETEGEIPYSVETRLEAELGRNPQYRYCVHLGQLAPARVFRIRSSGWETYLERSQAQGMRLGDVKPLGLSRDDQWCRVFNGRWLTPVGESGRATTRGTVGPQGHPRGEQAP